MSRTRSTLSYIHLMPDGNFVYGAHIDLARAESWHTPDGVLYLSASGTWVLQRPGESHGEFMAGRQLEEFCLRHRIPAPLPKDSDPKPANKARLTIRLGYPMRARLQAEADRKNKALQAIILDLLDDHLPPLQETQP